MSEIYRRMRNGEYIPWRGEKGVCDALINPEVDDCRGRMCDQCRKANEEAKRKKEKEKND